MCRKFRYPKAINQHFYGETMADIGSRTRPLHLPVFTIPGRRCHTPLSPRVWFSTPVSEDNVTFLSPSAVASAVSEERVVSQVLFLKDGC